MCLFYDVSDDGLHSATIKQQHFNCPGQVLRQNCRRDTRRPMQVPSHTTGAQSKLANESREELSQAVCAIASLHSTLYRSSLNNVLHSMNTDASKSILDPHC